mgnify:CR=1 FL=1
MTRPRRSLLFMPGSNARALEKARTLHADGVILDLEDSVAPDAKELARRLPQNGITLVDVRGRSEYAEVHVSGAMHIPLGYLTDRLSELPTEGTLITQCASGYRSQIAASLLQAAGFENVIAMNEGEECWAKFLPTASGNAHSF